MGIDTRCCIKAQLMNCQNAEGKAMGKIKLCR